MILKILVIGCFLCSLICVSEILILTLINGSPFCSDFSTAGAIIFFFLLVFIINRINSRLFKFLYLRKEELIVIYIMMIVSCAIVSWGLVLNLIGFIGGVYYYATDVNEWAKYIHPYLPKFLFISDREAIRYFYEGLPKGLGIPWRLWIIPLTNWFLFIIGFYLLSIFLMIMLREQWVERERLIYPLTELPTRMAEDKGFFKDKLMWLGFFIPFFFYSLIGLHKIFPQFPEIKLKTSISAFRGQFGFPLYFHFEMIGLAFLMSKDVLLSIWVFAIFYIILTGYLKMTGISIGYTIPYTDPASQEVAFLSFGALICFTLISIFYSRYHLRNIFLKAISKNNMNDENEVLPYKIVFWGFVLTFLYLIFFFVKVFGVKISVSIYFILITILIFTGITKIITQTGLAYYRAPMIPFAATIYTFGSKFIGQQGMVSLATSFIWAGDIRTTVMTSTANGLKLSTEFKINSKKIFFAILVSIFVSYITTSWFLIFLCYKNAGINLYSWHLKRLSDFVLSFVKSIMQIQPNFGKLQFFYTIIGIILMLFFHLLRIKVLWWPISPVGLATGIPLPIFFNWFSIFVAWLVKSLVMKYGGNKIYERAKVFFLGMVLGSFIVAGIWNIISYFTNVEGINFLF
jgi:hypothetical protein